MKRSFAILLLIFVFGITCVISRNVVTNNPVSAIKVTINGLSGGEVKSDVLINNPLVTDLPGINVTGFKVSVEIDGELRTVQCNGNRLNKEAANMIRSLATGTKIFIENIVCTDAQGNSQYASSLEFTVAPQ